MKTNSTQIIGYLSIAVILISLFFIGAKITGHVTADPSGIVNVTIDTSAAINFTTAVVDFGTGTVISGTAKLQSNGTGLNESWNGIGTAGELVLVNIGNVNVTLELAASQDAEAFIGAGATFSAMVKNTTGHTTSCVASNFSGNFQPINTTTQTACSLLTYSGNNSIDIDFEMQIPLDAVGTKTNTIIATATAAT